MKSKLKIDVLATDGSPLGVTEQSIHGLDGRMGVGGAELAILTIMRGWHERGHDVTFYNNPTVRNGSIFPQRPTTLFNPREDRDILIVFRSPNSRAEKAVGKKIWFSTDQHTIGSFQDFSTKMDEIVTISEFHAEHFRNTYQIHNSTVIDLPVRTWEYSEQVAKVKDSLIFCSVPDRGLSVLTSCYDELKQRVPNLTLAITSDYRLWGAAYPMNEKYIRRFLGKSGVRFLGAVSRKEMIQEQLKAQVHAYPCTYDELFCYASAECQVAGCFPITSATGALQTTNMGTIIQGNPESTEWKNRFIETVIISLNKHSEIDTVSKEIQKLAMERFSLDRILDEWDKVLYG